MDFSSFFKTKRFWKRLVITLASVQVLCFIGLYFYLSPRLNEPLVNAVLFHPNHRDAHQDNMKMLSGVPAEEVSLPVEGGSINGMFYRIAGTPDVVLLSHGNASDLDNRIDKIRAMLNCGISVFAYDYRGYGKSRGEPSIRGVIEDGVAAYDFLTKKQNYAPNNIVLFGESVGTGVSTEIARRRKCKAIILESGFTSPEERAKEKISVLNIYPSALMMDPRLDNLEYVKGSHPPFLLFAGKLDTMIPPQHSEKMFAQGTEPKQLIIGPNSTHNDFSKDWKLYIDGLHAFLEKNATLAEGKTQDGQQY